MKYIPLIAFGFLSISFTTSTHYYYYLNYTPREVKVTLELHACETKRGTIYPEYREDLWGKIPYKVDGVPTYKISVGGCLEKKDVAKAYDRYDKAHNLSISHKKTGTSGFLGAVKHYYYNVRSQ